MHASTTYSFDVRVLLCPSCGGPIDAAPAGGLVRCRYCNAQSDVVARGKLGAFTPRTEPPPSEPERLSRLAAQLESHLVAPPSLAHLMYDGGIAPGRRDDALAAFQSARRRTSTEQDAVAADELFFLTQVLGDELVMAKDWARHRALIETALEAFFLRRHRSTMAAEMCLGACRDNDLPAADAWLALADAHSDDLMADSMYRVAAARVAALRNDFARVIAILGGTEGEVPIHQVERGVVCVRRADAWEHLGRVDAAVTELATRMEMGPSQRRHVEEVVRLHGLCPRSFPEAAARAASRAAEKSAALASGGNERGFGASAIFLVLGALGIVAGIALAATSSDVHRGPAASPAVWVTGGLGVMFLLVGAIVRATTGGMKHDADAARWLATNGVPANGVVLSVVDMGTMGGAVVRAAVRMRVALDRTPPFEAEAHVVLAPHALPSVGDTLRVRVDPNDRTRVALEG